MEDIESEAGAKAPAKPVERVTLGAGEAEKVAAWLKQLEESSKGFLQLSRSDVVNFLVREHKPELSSRELQQIRNYHYDPVRHLNWITPRLRDALLKNDVAAVQALQAEIRGIELSVVSTAKEFSKSNECAGSSLPNKPRRRRAKKSDLADASDGLSIAELQAEIPEG